MSDQDSELYPQFSRRIGISETETEMCLKQIVKSWKKAKSAKMHFLEILNNQLKFEIPK